MSVHTWDFVKHKQLPMSDGRLLFAALHSDYNASTFALLLFCTMCVTAHSMSAHLGTGRSNTKQQQNHVLFTLRGHVHVAGTCGRDMQQQQNHNTFTQKKM